MQLADLSNRVNWLRHKMYKHNLWTKEAIDEILNDRTFSLEDLMMFEACFKGVK